MEGTNNPEGIAPIKTYSSPQVAMGRFEQALEIAQSRLDFYNTRQELLTGTDEASLAYQNEVNADKSVNITADGAGLEYIMAILQNPEKQKEYALQTVIKGNLVFIHQWEFVQSKITSLKRKWSEEEFQDLEKARVYFDLKKSATKIDEAKKDYNIHKDITYISSDGIDFDAIHKLLISTEPYLKLQQKLIETEEKAKQEHLRQAKSKQLWETKSIEEIVDWINKKEQPPKAQVDKKKKHRKKKRPLQTDQEGKSTTENNILAAPAASQSTETSSMPSQSSTQSITTQINTSQLGPVTNISNHEKITKTDETLSATAATEDAEKSIEDYVPTFQQHPTNINNPKTRRVLKKEKAIKGKEDSQSAAIIEGTTPQLKLHSSYIETLTDVLKVVSHPPTWTESVKAICEVIKQWGGSYREDLGDGSTAEFWIGNTRFITDKTHNNGLMYKAQMKFMKKGLNRAGITLEYLSQLKSEK